MVFPLSALLAHWGRSLGKASERRHRRKVELYRLRNRQAGAETAGRNEVQALVAEHEARRMRDSNFTGPERERLATARKLLRIASDAAATPAERQTAYKRARRELDGLIVLPEATLASLEEKIAGMLDAGPTRSRPPF